MRKSKNMKTSIQDNLKPFCVNSDAEAIVLITTAMGKEKKVIRRLKCFPELKEAHIVHGSYDIIARFKTQKYAGLSKLLNIKIKKIEGIRASRTLLVP